MTTLIEKIKTALAGIDQTETDSAQGWWETDTGAAFGAKKLQEVIAALSAEQTEPVATEGFVLMPMTLTAENGAKAALSGEFAEKFDLTCQACAEAEEIFEDCEVCGGSGVNAVDVPVGWDTIKKIYSRAVEVLASPIAAPASQPSDIRRKALNYRAVESFSAWWDDNYQKLSGYSIYSKCAAVWNAALAQAPQEQQEQAWSDRDSRIYNEGYNDALETLPRKTDTALVAQQAGQPAPAVPEGFTFAGWFYRTSEFGPWRECKPGQEGAHILYIAAPAQEGKK